MRYVPVLILLLVLSSSCTLLQPEGVLVNGKYWQVTHADVRHAIALAKEHDAVFRLYHVGEVQVLNSSELHVYIGEPEPGAGCWAVIKRINGQWSYIRSEERIFID